MYRFRIGAVIAALAGSAIIVSAADPSFNGTWKMNLAKSQLAGQTLIITKAAAGNNMHFDMQGFAYDFDLTGKEFPTPDGGTTSWKQVSPTTWDATMKANGKVVAMYHITVAANTMTAVMKMTSPTGTPVEQTMVAKRDTSGPGLIGRWKTTEAKGTPTTLVIAMDANGIKVNYPELQFSCSGKFDGKDNPVTGAGAASKEMLAFEKISATSFKITTKIDGKPYYVDTLVLSADGKTITDSGKPVAVNEPVKMVYEKQ